MGVKDANLATGNFSTVDLYVIDMMGSITQF